jgi:hypothetical protein
MKTPPTDKNLLYESIKKQASNQNFLPVLYPKHIATQMDHTVYCLRPYFLLKRSTRPSAVANF